MPRKKNNGFNNELSILTTMGELTVHDVANSERKRQCLKKSNVCGVVTKAYQDNCNNGDVAMQDRLSDDDEDREMDELSSFPPVTGTKRKRRRKSESTMDTTGSLSLPIDFWELISEHIRPEDVGRFAAICHTTAYVVSTARFWYSLYNRYCGHCLILPEDLCQWELRSAGAVGLRNRVVRALYLSYPLFTRTLLRPGGGGGVPHHKPYSTDTIIAPTDRLLHSRCHIYWHMRRGSSHHYVFKFFHRDRLPNQALFGRRLGDAASTSHQLQPPSCRHAEDACYLLEVVCSSVCQVPNSAVGQFLNLVCESPAEVTNYRMNKLELTLSGAPYTYSNRSYAAHHRNNVYRPIGWNDTTKVVLQPVTSVLVLPWWDPLYYSVCCPSFSHEDDDCDKLGDGAW